MGTEKKTLPKNKSCSYCGSKNGNPPTPAILQWPRKSGKYRWTVTCCDCGAHGPIMPTEDQAVAVYQSGVYQELVNWNELPEAENQNGVTF